MQKIHHYLNLIRFDRPVGTWLLFLPCMFALLLGKDSFPSSKEVVIFLLGAFLMRSSGCIINDLWDRKIDCKVARTKNRPLASGKIKVIEALFILFLFLLISAFLLFQFNAFTIKLGLISLLFVATYPLMKRITWYPQIFLGLTFNFGILIAYSSLHEALNFISILLYLAGMCWTIGYDTIYGHQDIVDDLAIGLKSTSIKFGKHSKKIILSCYMSFLLLLLYIGLANGLGIVYFILLNIVGLIMLHNISLCDLANPDECATEFKRNIYYGFIILVVICVAKGVATIF